MRTLIVGAHLDDETFGMGGLLYDLCEQNAKDVMVLTFCHGRDQANSEARKAAAATIQSKLGFRHEILGYHDMELELELTKNLTRYIEDAIDGFKPHRVFTVSENDIHQDHKIISNATKIACRPERTDIREIFEFRIPGSEPYTSSHYDTIYKTKYMGHKTWMIGQYKTENQPKPEYTEYFRTVYRKFIL